MASCAVLSHLAYGTTTILSPVAEIRPRPRLSTRPAAIRSSHGTAPPRTPSPRNGYRSCSQHGQLCGPESPRLRNHHHSEPRRRNPATAQALNATSRDPLFPRNRPHPELHHRETATAPVLSTASCAVLSHLAHGTTTILNPIAENRQPPRHQRNQPRSALPTEPPPPRTPSPRNGYRSCSQHGQLRGPESPRPRNHHHSEPHRRKPATAQALNATSYAVASRSTYRTVTRYVHCRKTATAPAPNAANYPTVNRSPTEPPPFHSIAEKRLPAGFRRRGESHHQPTPPSPKTGHRPGSQRDQPHGRTTATRLPTRTTPTPSTIAENRPRPLTGPPLV